MRRAAGSAGPFGCPAELTQNRFEDVRDEARLASPSAVAWCRDLCFTAEAASGRPLGGIAGPHSSDTPPEGPR